MPETPVFDLPGICAVTYDAATRAAIIRWESFRTPDVQDVVRRHIREGQTRGARICVVDVSQIRGVLDPADAAWVEQNTPGLLTAAGYDAIVNVLPSSAITKMGADRWGRAALGHGLTAYSCSSVAEVAGIARDVLGKAA
ncbi:hypothetical protein [Nocardioides sp. GY 10127]|uniref:hypothetical protein n=1 Tax=Nocardioides sp. GY 10127 TaxID=2569762 RepID=UPI0010A8047D|nr:hypothetical protein [Nocardioides sp. GY 10127]TIC78924.1 hypothetical protein E8D37_18790 [Nocardioides sp. GY 10127]